MDNKILVIGGIAIVGLLLLSKKKGSGTITDMTTGNTVKTTTNTDGSTTHTTTDSTGAVVSTVVNVKNTDGTVTSTITDAAGNTQTVTNHGNATPVTGIGYVDAVPGVTLGIPTDLYNDYLANKDKYAAAGKPPPLQFDNTIPGQVTVIPYDDPTHPVTYADPDGSLTFTNVNGTPVPNDPSAIVVNTEPVVQSAPIKWVATPPIIIQNITTTPASPSIPTSVAAEAAENIALAANPGNAPVNTDSEGNQYVINNEGEAVYLGVPTFADNLAAAGLVEVNGVWTYPS
jgi:hypothetical protein